MQVKHALSARDVLKAKTRLETREQLKAKTRLDGRVCLVLLTDLIIRDGGKLVCQILKRIMLFGWCGLGGFWGFEGLDKGILLGFLRGRGRKMAYPRGDPRLKPRATSPFSFVQLERAKAEALAYLEARARATARANTGILAAPE